MGRRRDDSREIHEVLQGSFLATRFRVQDLGSKKNLSKHIEADVSF